MKKTIVCKKQCGEYGISDQMFDAFTTPEARENIARMVPKATKARIVLNDGCPRCLPSGTTYSREAEIQASQK